jgi:hypothetical protein
MRSGGAGDLSRMRQITPESGVQEEISTKRSSSANGLGRTHWPHGFVQIYIGGPIREGQAGRSAPRLGIYPFDGEGVAFVPADVQGQTEGAAAARSVLERVFGLSV